jgi:glycine betaine transporter
VQLIVIVVTTVAFMISASTAINKGINYLSQISMYLAGVLLVFFLVMGPTATQLGALTQGIGDYLGGIVPMSMRLDSFAPTTAGSGAIPSSTGPGGSPGALTSGCLLSVSRAGAPSASSLREQ